MKYDKGEILHRFYVRDRNGRFSSVPGGGGKVPSTNKLHLKKGPGLKSNEENKIKYNSVTKDKPLTKQQISEMTKTSDKMLNNVMGKIANSKTPTGDSRVDNMIKLGKIVGDSPQQQQQKSPQQQKGPQQQQQQKGPQQQKQKGPQQPQQQKGPQQQLPTINISKADMETAAKFVKGYKDSLKVKELGKYKSLDDFSNKELQDAIMRGNLEKQYNSMFGTKEYTKKEQGKIKVDRYLGYAGTALSVGGTIAGAYEIYKKMT